MTSSPLGYALPLDRVEPAEAIELARLAEAHGFGAVLAAEQFQPWLPAHGQAPFAWSVLAAIGQATGLELGTVTAPTFRWHPATVAQAAATLAALNPGRHWLALGSGEALNEHVVGQYWPEAPERINRMFEAVEIIKKLFASGLAGREVKHEGQFFRLESSRLWTMPERAPKLLIATGGPVTARRAGRVADGIITEAGPPEKLVTLLQRFADGTREGGREPCSQLRMLRLHLAWAPTDDEAAAIAAREWPHGVMRFPRADIRSPFEVEQLARMVRPEDAVGRLPISADPEVHRAHLQSLLDLGFDRVLLHNVGRNQREFLEVFGREVLPKLRR